MRMTFSPTLCGAEGATQVYLNQSPGRSQKYKYKVYSPWGGDGGETVKAKARERRVFKIGAHVDVDI